MSDLPIYQLVYTSVYSSARVDNALTALRDILKTSRVNNEKQDVTGYLIFDGEMFLQVLEGEHAQVAATYDRIARDGRHRETRVIGSRHVDTRDFAGWAMAGYRRGPREADIFRRYGIEGPLAEVALSPETAIALARELATNHADPAG